MPSVAGALNGGHHAVLGELLQVLQSQVQLLQIYDINRLQIKGGNKLEIPEKQNGTLALRMSRQNESSIAESVKKS